MSKLEPLNHKLEPIVRLNIGGYCYVTTKQTLEIQGRENFFTRLISGQVPSIKDSKGQYFIDRDGKYFEPILEYLRTGDVVIPRDISLKSVVREANFYNLEFPLHEESGSLEFITDGWLNERRVARAYDKICKMGDYIVTLVLQDFKRCADEGIQPIESSLFVYPEKTADQLISKWSHNFLEYDLNALALENIRAILDQWTSDKKRVYAKEVHETEYFDFLDQEEHQGIIVDYLKKNSLTVSPVKIIELQPIYFKPPWLKITQVTPVIEGIKFVHTKKSEFHEVLSS